MPRELVVGNGNILVCFDRHAHIKDFFFPHVGQENHVSGHTHKIGIWTDSKISWFGSGDWKHEIEYEKESLVGKIKSVNEEIKITVKREVCVDHDNNIFIEKIKITNNADYEREIKIFINQHFHIAGRNSGDTVYYDPRSKSIIYYKGKRYFLIGGNFSGYATGTSGFGSMEGTYKDAEDGQLSGNPIEHGSVDSTIEFRGKLKPGRSFTADYWIAAGKNYDEVCSLNSKIKKEKTGKIIKENKKYWKSWVNKQKFTFYNMRKEVAEHFKKSLLIIRTQIDNNGPIIAANDSDIMQFNKDTYSYMWPRDGALVSLSLDVARYSEITTKFFNFSKKVLAEQGFLMHKYNPDGSPGSSWHSWIENGAERLPIQEDETALVIYALWHHYQRYKNIEFVDELYFSLVKPAADFMVNYREENGLPKPSYDLWEEKFGIFSFTASAVYGGLKAAEKFAELFGNKEDKNKYSKAAEEMKEAIINCLYDNEVGFVKGIYDKKTDRTVDASSAYGVFFFKVLDSNDEKLKRSFAKIEEKLKLNTLTGGVARHENDDYYRVSSELPGNPWFITTLWLADYYTETAKNEKDLQKALNIINWAVDKSKKTGVMSEQLHPYTGEHISVSPLTWSHAAFIHSVIKYMQKLEELGVCKMCSPK